MKKLTNGVDYENYNRNLNKFRMLYLQGDRTKRSEYMKQMEKTFRIPIIENRAYNRENPKVMDLYTKFSDWLE